MSASIDTPSATEDLPPAEKQSDDEILAEARDRYRMCGEMSDFNYNAARADLKFLVGGDNQWPDDVVAFRTQYKMPMITVNTLPTYLHQVTNDQRMNSPSIKVHPVDDNADLETARIYQGMIRHIEYDSNADVAYDTSVNSGAAIGFGWFRVTVDYESDASLDRCLKIDRIANALSVKVDPLSTEPDGSDMQYAFVEYVMARDEFKRQYPDAAACADSLSTNPDYLGWFPDKSVLICDYYRIEKKKAEVVKLSNGMMGVKDDLLKPFGGKLPEGLTIIDKRESDRCTVMMRKITAVDVLEETEIKCPWIPVFPVYGDEVNIDGKVYRSGIVRHAKGPAQMYNVMMTGAVEEVALRSKTPWVMAEGQQEGHEKEWAAANRLPLPYLTYKPTTLDGKVLPAPQRSQMADVPVGMLALAQQASENIKKTTGLFSPSLGQPGNATSGKQELAQQREGDMANFHYSDGLNRTIRHLGRCIVYMIPHYYDTRRTVRILGEDDKAEYVTINDPNVEGKPNEAGKVKAVLNDVTVGKFDITVSAGPSYSTLRQESADAMGNAFDKNPALWQIAGDVYVRSQDWPMAEELAKRLEKTIPKELLEKKDGEEEQEPVIDTPRGPLPVSQAGQALAALEQELAQAKEALQKSQADKQQAEVLKQQHMLNEQSLEPQRLAVEQAKIQASQAEAQASIIAAETDQIRARAEAATAPERARAELLTARASVIQAGREPAKPAEGGEQEPESEPAPVSPLDMVPTLGEIIEVIQASRPQLPKGMTIKSPISGLDYDVSLH